MMKAVYFCIFAVLILGLVHLEIGLMFASLAITLASVGCPVSQLDESLNEIRKSALFVSDPGKKFMLRVTS